MYELLRFVSDLAVLVLFAVSVVVFFNGAVPQATFLILLAIGLSLWNKEAISHFTINVSSPALAELVRKHVETKLSSNQPGDK